MNTSIDLEKHKNAPRSSPMDGTRRAQFWRRHPGLAWPNPKADDSTKIRAALLRPRFHRLLDIASEFGVMRLRTEWRALSVEGDSPAQSVQDVVVRILDNIEKGFANADAGS